MNNNIPFIFQANNTVRRQPTITRITPARRRAAELVRRSAVRQRTRDFQKFTRNRWFRQEAAENRVRPEERPRARNQVVQRRSPLVRPGARGVRSVNRANFTAFAQEVRRQTNRDRQETPVVLRRSARLASRQRP